MNQKKKEKVVRAFIKRYRKKGYTDITVKEDNIIEGFFVVSTVEPLGNRVINVRLTVLELESKGKLLNS